MSGQKKSILYLALEFVNWPQACHVAYSCQLGFAEGLEANGSKVFVVTTPWLPNLKELCSGRSFDQVWVEVIHNDVNDEIMEYLATLAPIRVGIIAESLNYTEREIELAPNLGKRKARVQNFCQYLTHLVSSDEFDAQELNELGVIKAAWWAPIMGPVRYANSQICPSLSKPALFIGALYLDREDIVTDEELQSCITHMQSPDGKMYPYLFGKIHWLVEFWQKKRLPGRRAIHGFYNWALRRIRLACHQKWLNALRNGCAVLNLPHIVKNYPGRVLDGLSMSVPVISWRLNGRPRNDAMFKDEQEILFFDHNDYSTLTAQIKRVQSDRSLVEKVTRQGYEKVVSQHSPEVRLKQLLDWIETGVEPNYE